MGIYIDPELMKPLRCSDCGGQRIANMINEGVIRCLSCGKEKPDPNSVMEQLKREMGEGGSNVWTSSKNPHPHRTF